MNLARLQKSVRNSDLPLKWPKTFIEATRRFRLTLPSREPDRRRVFILGLDRPYCFTSFSSWVRKWRALRPLRLSGFLRRECFVVDNCKEQSTILSDVKECQHRVCQM